MTYSIYIYLRFDENIEHTKIKLHEMKYKNYLIVIKYLNDTMDRSLSL